MQDDAYYYDAGLCPPPPPGNDLLLQKSHLSTSRPVLDAMTLLSSSRVVPSSRPRSLAEDAPDPHVIFRLSGIAHGETAADATV